MTKGRLTLISALSATALTAFAGTAAAQGRCGASYDMQYGDTLYRVSQECRVSLAMIMELNPDLGNIRDIPAGTTLRLVSETESGSDSDRDRDRDGSPDRYRVEAGDTMFSISRQFGVSLYELMNQNPDLDPFTMAVGELLDIPQADDRQAAVSVSPCSGPSGSEVTVSARNLRPNDWVTIGAGRTASEWRALREVQVAADGEIRADVRVPQWADRDDRLIFVVDTDRGMTFKSGDFDVTRASSGGGDDNDEGRFVELEGVVRQGVECYTLTTRDGDTWSLVSDDVEFTEGEYVEVEGHRAEMSFCQQGLGTVDVEDIREVAAPGDGGDNGRDDGEQGLTRAALRGAWTAKGGSCARPDFDVGAYSGSGRLSVETSFNGSPRTGDVRLSGEDSAFVFDQPYTEIGIESRGEGQLAVMAPAALEYTLGGHALDSDGVVFVRC